MFDKRQPNHKTFNFFNPTTGHAVSVKTMDTLGLSGSKPMTPEGAA
ncbi:endonuclease toxin domain-containing protein, partial [Verminephrobacter aporrectodeae]